MALAKQRKFVDRSVYFGFFLIINNCAELSFINHNSCDGVL